MSDNEEFLARWSRRKLEAKQGSQAELDTPELIEAKSGEPAGGPAAELADPDVNLSNLPPIDSIEAATDITTFLGSVGVGAAHTAVRYLVRCDERLQPQAIPFQLITGCPLD